MLICILDGFCVVLCHQHLCANVLVVFIVFVSLTFVLCAPLGPASLCICVFTLEILVSSYFVVKITVVPKSSCIPIACLHATGSAMACIA